DQLVGNRGDSAALKARAAGQISAGDGLMLTNQVEHDATIDVAGGLASGDAKVAQVYFSHDRPGNLVSPRTIYPSSGLVHKKMRSVFIFLFVVCRREGHGG